MQHSSNIAAVDSIRGLAALVVVIFHIPVWNGIVDVTFLRNGYLMVDLFFVLSGFVIFRAYSGNIGSVRDLAVFQGLRFGRLYPVHLVFLVVFLAIELVKLVAQYRYGITSPNATAFKDGVGTPLLQHLFLVQAIGPWGHPHSLNGPAWSISVEFYTYLVFGALVLLSRKWAMAAFAALHVAALVALISGHTLGFTLILQCWCGFFLGCLVAIAVTRARHPLSAFYTYVSLGALVLFLASKTDSRFDPLIYFATALFLYCVLRTPASWPARALGLRPLVWLGTISYSLYMCHYPIIWVFNQVVRAVLKRPEVMAAGYSTPALGPVETILLLGVLVPTVLAVSHFVYSHVEMPCRHLSRGLLLGRQVSPISGAGLEPASSAMP